MEKDDEVFEEEVVVCFYVDYGEDYMMVPVYSATDYGLIGDFVANIDKSELPEYIAKLTEAIKPVYGKQIPFSL